ncbi:MAG: hypothetical protein BGO49_20265 [Planctomycetales bacterium 71-10]|nr:MAG: hypothetical protein BGO49_20265 [Planctomycetales bacterium 71-10]
MEETIFLLIGNLSETELAEYRRLSERTLLVYERALLDRDAPQEAVHEFLDHDYEHLRVLCIRSVEQRADLMGWFGVGEAIADLLCRVEFDGERPDQAVVRDRFERAFDGLSGRDRKLAESLTDDVQEVAGEEHQYRLINAYGDLAQVLASQKPESFEEPKPRSTETGPSILVEEIEGFAHNADFSICKVGGRVFQPSGAMRLIVHALYALRVEGIHTPKWGQIVEKARLLYGHKSPMLDLLLYAEDKRPDKEFKRQDLWKTVVKPNPKPKGSYSLVLGPETGHENPQESARKDDPGLQ